MADHFIIDVGTDATAPMRDLLIDDLDGQAFRIVLTWRDRPECWFLDLYTSDGTALLCGAALQPGSPLLLRRQGPQWPGGALGLHDASGGDSACTLAGLGVTHELVYIPAATVSAWRASLINDEGLTFSTGA
jgi:hypothetical protein